MLKRGTIPIVYYIRCASANLGARCSGIVSMIIFVNATFVMPALIPCNTLLAQRVYKLRNMAMLEAKIANS